MRYYAAIITGMLTGITSMAALWNWTTMDVLEIAVWAVLIYLAAMCAVLWATESKKNQTRKHMKPQIYDLKEGGYGR